VGKKGKKRQKTFLVKKLPKSIPPDIRKQIVNITIAKLVLRERSGEVKAQRRPHGLGGRPA